MGAEGSETAEKRESGRCGLGDGRGEGEWALRTRRRPRRGRVGAADLETVEERESGRCGLGDGR